MTEPTEVETSGLLADPAQTTELAIARCQTSCDDDCEAPCHESHEVLTRRHHDVDECEAGQRRWAEMRAERDGYYRQWMSTRETVHKRTAERDALSLLLRGMARKLVAYRKWMSGDDVPVVHRLRRELDEVLWLHAEAKWHQEQLDDEALRWTETAGQHAEELEQARVEGGERQARIDAALAELDEDGEDWHGAVDAERVRAALVGDQP